MTKAIFMDIDGPVCNIRSHIAAGIDGMMQKFDPITLGMVDRLLDIDPETKLVISSVWRLGMTREELLQRFRDEGFKGDFHDDWRTPYTEKGFRGDEIKAWLSQHPDVTNFICIDDDEDFYPDQNLVKISIENGLLYQDFRKACLLLYGNADAWADKVIGLRTPSRQTTPAL